MIPSRFRIRRADLAATAKSEFWGLPLFLALFAITFTLLVFLVTIFESFGSNILPIAAVFTFLSAIFWILDPLLKERLPPFVSSVFLIAVYLISAQLLIIASGGINSPFFLVYCFVMFTGAMSHGLTGALVVTGIIAIAYGTFFESIVDLPLYLTNVIILWIVALMVGFLAETKKRVERRVALQNARLLALEEVAAFMRDLSRPEDVIDSGIEAAQKLLAADSVIVLDNDRVIHEKHGDAPFDPGSSGESFELTLGNHCYSLVIRRGIPLIEDERRILSALLEKIRLIWLHRQDRAVIESAREEKERVLDAIGSAVLSINDDGAVRTANSVAADLFGVERDRLSTINIYRALVSLPPVDSIGLDPLEREIKLPSGELVPVQVKVFPEFDESLKRVGWIVILDNLKEIRRLEAGLRKAEDLAALGEMSARVAHEIRNPLGGILGFLGLAARKSTPDVTNYINEAKDAVNRLEMTVRDLLTFASPTRGIAESFELGEAWKDAARPHEAGRTSNRHVIRFESTEPLFSKTKIVGQPHLFIQVLDNLVRNAREAAREEGTVEVLADDAGAFIKVDVVDDGPGCEPDILEKIFDPFVSGKARGTGLGLSIARKILTDIGGSVNYSRISRKGGDFTCFSFTWPKSGM